MVKAKAEIEDLADETLKAAIEKFASHPASASLGFESFFDPGGEICVRYRAEVRDGVGSVEAVYRPLEAVRKMVKDCYRLTEPGEDVKDLALVATALLLVEFGLFQLSHALKENFEDSLFILGAALAHSRTVDGKYPEADFSQKVEEAAKKTARRRKEVLNAMIRIALTSVRTTREKAGRTPTFKDGEHYRTTLREIRQKLVSAGLGVTQGRIAEEIAGAQREAIDDSMVRQWNRQYGVDWKAFKSGGNV